MKSVNVVSRLCWNVGGSSKMAAQAIDALFDLYKGIYPGCG